MKNLRLITLALSLSFPLSAFAATTDSISSEDILNAVDPASITGPAVSTPAEPAYTDGKGGGTMNSSIYYPGPTSGGVQVTADVTASVTPDFVGINAYCDSGKMPSRQAIRDAMQQLYTDIKNFVGKDGRVRKSGTVSAYPFYDQSGTVTDSFTGNLSIFIRITNKAKAQAISDYIEQKNCSVNWDVRLVNTQKHELSVLDELATQLNSRKAVFEKLLHKRLTLISGATLSTWVDSYGTYDPDADTVDATTTLTVTFDLGGRTTINVPTPVRK